jgi:hypothetical protein
MDEALDERIDEETALLTTELFTEELLLDKLERLTALELLTDVAFFAIEHSLVPPDTLVPAPNVTSPQTKLPLRVL